MGGETAMDAGVIGCWLDVRSSFAHGQLHTALRYELWFPGLVDKKGSKQRESGPRANRGLQRTNSMDAHRPLPARYGGLKTLGPNHSSQLPSFWCWSVISGHVLSEWRGLLESPVQRPSSRFRRLVGQIQHTVIPSNLSCHDVTPPGGAINRTVPCSTAHTHYYYYDNNSK
jgi:hypothetical protein